MAKQILQFLRSAVPSKKPTTSQIELGELSMNTYDGRLFMKKSGSIGESIASFVSFEELTGSFVSITGSLQGTASFATTASYVVGQSATASYALTASYADNFTVGGTLTAQRVVVQTISSSIVYSSGSNRFGNDITNTQTFTGSVGITGSLAVNGASQGFIFTDHVSNNTNFALYPKVTPSLTNYLLRSDGSNLLLNAPVSSGAIFFTLGNNSYGRFINNTGNFLLQNGGTFTDNGYRLQVQPGVSGSLFVSGSSSFTGSVDITGSLTVKVGTGETRFGGANGRTLSAYNNGALDNFDFAAIQTYFNSDLLINEFKKISTQNGAVNDLYLTTYSPSASIYTDRSLKIIGNISGSYVANNPSSSLVILSGSITPSASLSGSSAMYVNTVLSASANSQILVGLDINPTFANGAFTGVNNYAIRANGKIFALGALELGRNAASTGGSQTILYADSAETTLMNNATGARIAFRVNSTDYGRFMPTTGNLILQNGGTFTDNGYRLQVNGSGSASGSLFVSGSSVFSGSVNVSGSILQNGGRIAVQDGTILYSPTRAFTPTGSISTSGTTVTVVGNHFDSGVVGMKLTILGESRIITAYTSVTQVSVDSTYSQNYSGIAVGSWGVYYKVFEVKTDGYPYFYLGNQAGGATPGSTFIYNSGGFPSTQYGWSVPNYNLLNSSGLHYDKNSFIRWSNTTSYDAFGNTTNDLGLRRNNAGLLEIYDGTTYGAYRDLILRNITGSNATFSGSVGITGSLTSTGTITAQRLVVQTISSSIVYSSGSNNFGNDITNTQTFTGSVGITGSLDVNSNLTVNGTSTTVPTIALNASGASSNNQFFDFRISNNSKFQFGYTQSPPSGNRFFIYNSILSQDSFRIIESTNNVAIGYPNSITDTGFRLDVSGSTRLNGNTTVTGSVGITGSLYTDGLVVHSGILSGSYTANNPSSSLIILSGSITPSASLGGASIIYANTVISASANNQTLVGLDINPTFNTGSFTGVTPLGLRIKNPGGDTITIGQNSTYSFISEIKSTGRIDISTFNSNIFFNAINTFYQSTFVLARNGDASSTSTQTNSRAFTFESSLWNGSTSGQYYDGFRTTASTTINLQRRLSFITNTNSALTTGTEVFAIFNSGSVVLQNGGTFTDNGYRLQVSGSASGSLYTDGLVVNTGTLSGSYTPNNPSSSLIILSGSITPSASLSGSSAMYVNTVLSASANNQSLVGLDINPSFNNGAFTGVTNTALKVSSAAFEVAQFLRIGNGSSRITVGNTAGTLTTIMDANSSTGAAFGSLTGTDVSYVTGQSAKLKMIHTTGDVIIQNGGTFTDNGYRLQVNGSGSASGSLFVSGSSMFSGSVLQSGSLTSYGPNTFVGNTTITGSVDIAGSLSTTGTLTAQTLVIQTVSSSVVYASGSNIFGNSLANTQTMTGSVGITGSLTVAGNILPSLTNTYALGSNSNQFNNVYSTVGVISNLYTATIRASGNSILFGSNQTNYWGGFIGTSSTSSANFILNYTSSAGLGGDNGYKLQIYPSGSASGSLFVSGSSVFNGTATIVSASLNYQENLAVATGSFQTITSVATGSYRSAFFDYVAYSGSVVRAGTVISTWSGSVTEYYENYTNDLGGSTSVVSLQTAISGSNIQLQAGISGSAWSVRSLVRLL